MIEPEVLLIVLKTDHLVTMNKQRPEEVCLDSVCLNLAVRMLLDYFPAFGVDRGIFESTSLHVRPLTSLLYFPLHFRARSNSRIANAMCKMPCVQRTLLLLRRLPSRAFLRLFANLESALFSQGGAEKCANKNEAAF